MRILAALPLLALAACATPQERAIGSSNAMLCYSVVVDEPVNSAASRNELTRRGYTCSPYDAQLVVEERRLRIQAFGRALEQAGASMSAASPPPPINCTTTTTNGFTNTTCR